MNINTLRELIRTGEFLEENYKDDKVRSQWLFAIETFAKENNCERDLESYLSALKFHGGKNIGKNSFNSIMGFLRNLYNNDTSENKLIAANSQSVFIVHGHDDSLIAEVKACVSELSLEPIVLREQPDKGKTIIEKLEDWLGNCKCAVILYTPCDEGKAVGETELKHRARQNVVYEHGLFQGYLGRRRVILLKKGDTQPPGDYDGVIYKSVDADDWRVSLKNEILAIDSNS
jgi:predicted nucleotide-binding protein